MMEIDTWGTFQSIQKALITIETGQILLNGRYYMLFWIIKYILIRAALRGTES